MEGETHDQKPVLSPREALAITRLANRLNASASIMSEAANAIQISQQQLRWEPAAFRKPLKTSRTTTHWTIRL
jgi:hypothetical protein